MPLMFVIPIMYDNIDGLVQGRCNSSAIAMELHLSCINRINPLICNNCIYLMVKNATFENNYLQYQFNQGAVILDI